MRGIDRPAGLGSTKVRVATALIGSALGLALAPGSAAANNANYACQLLPSNHAIEQLLGLPHLLKEENKGGGTDEADGSFSSSCFVLAYKKKPPAGVNPFGRPPANRVRKGFAKLAVTTEIQDEGSGGENWDPERERYIELEALELDLEEVGAHAFSIPDWGKTDAHACEWGERPDNATAFWQDGEDGFVVIGVGSHGGAERNLTLLSQSVVPQFNP